MSAGPTTGGLPQISTPFSYSASVLNGPWTSHSPLFGNSAAPQTSTGPVYSVSIAQCALSMTCRELALAGLFLARDGVLSDGTQLLSPRETKRVNAVMLTCGTYDAAGDFAYRVGLPGKSGVGGGIIAVVPGRCTLCVWSPGLDERGNSVAGVAALDRFTTLTGLSIF